MQRNGNKQEIWVLMDEMGECRIYRWTQKYIGNVERLDGLNVIRTVLSTMSRTKERLAGLFGMLMVPIYVRRKLEANEAMMRWRVNYKQY